MVILDALNYLYSLGETQIDTNIVIYMYDAMD